MMKEWKSLITIFEQILHSFLFEKRDCLNAKSYLRIAIDIQVDDGGNQDAINNIFFKVSINKEIDVSSLISDGRLISLCHMVLASQGEGQADLVVDCTGAHKADTSSIVVGKRHSFWLANHVDGPQVARQLIEPLDVTPDPGGHMMTGLRFKIGLSSSVVQKFHIDLSDLVYASKLMNPKVCFSICSSGWLDFQLDLNNEKHVQFNKLQVYEETDIHIRYASDGNFCHIECGNMVNVKCAVFGKEVDVKLTCVACFIPLRKDGETNEYPSSHIALRLYSSSGVPLNLNSTNNPDPCDSSSSNQSPALHPGVVAPWSDLGLRLKAGCTVKGYDVQCGARMSSDGALSQALEGRMSRFSLLLAYVAIVDQATCPLMPDTLLTMLSTSLESLHDATSSCLSKILPWEYFPRDVVLDEQCLVDPPTMSPLSVEHRNTELCHDQLISMSAQTPAIAERDKIKPAAKTRHELYTKLVPEVALSLTDIFIRSTNPVFRGAVSRFIPTENRQIMSQHLESCLREATGLDCKTITHAENNQQDQAVDDWRADTEHGETRGLGQGEYRQGEADTDVQNCQSEQVPKEENFSRLIVTNGNYVSHDSEQQQQQQQLQLQNNLRKQKACSDQRYQDLLSGRCCKDTCSFVEQAEVNDETIPENHACHRNYQYSDINTFPYDKYNARYVVDNRNAVETLKEPKNLFSHFDSNLDQISHSKANQTPNDMIPQDKITSHDMECPFGSSQSDSTQIQDIINGKHGVNSGSQDVTNSNIPIGQNSCLISNYEATSGQGSQLSPFSLDSLDFGSPGYMKERSPNNCSKRDILNLSPHAIHGTYSQLITPESCNTSQKVCSKIVSLPSTENSSSPSLSFHPQTNSTTHEHDNSSNSKLVFKNRERLIDTYEHSVQMLYVASENLLPLTHEEVKQQSSFSRKRSSEFIDDITNVFKSCSVEDSNNLHSLNEGKKLKKDFTARSSGHEIPASLRKQQEASYYTKSKDVQDQQEIQGRSPKLVTCDFWEELPFSQDSLDLTPLAGDYAINSQSRFHKEDDFNYHDSRSTFMTENKIVFKCEEKENSVMNPTSDVVSSCEDKLTNTMDKYVSDLDENGPEEVKSMEQNEASLEDDWLNEEEMLQWQALMA